MDGWLPSLTAMQYKARSATHVSAPGLVIPEVG
nr:MAG TPA: hypothetical protein [Caudoviricetes sp.]